MRPSALSRSNRISAGVLIEHAKKGTALEIVQIAIYFPEDQLRDENTRLRKLVADLSPDKDALQWVIEKNGWSSRS